VDERFNYKKEDTDDPSFIGIFCATCDVEIGYGACLDCDEKNPENFLRLLSESTSEKLQQIQVQNSDQAWEIFLHPLASMELAQKLEEEYNFLDQVERPELISTVIEAKLARQSEKTVDEYFDLGEIFYDEKSFALALPILKSAADEGHNLAAEKTANCYSKLGYPELAVPYWEFCRTEGNHSANTNYASYLTTQGRDLDFALKLWREAADAGIPQAAFNLGVWLKNSGEMEEGKLYLKKSGELGYLDGYYVLAGVYYKAQDWENMSKFLAPLLEINDQRAIKMHQAVEEQLGRNNPVEDMDDESEFDWNNYDWNWKTPEDVKAFVDLVLENFSTYEYAYESLGQSSDGNFYSLWWGPVQQAVKSMAENFERSDLEEAMMHLLAPEGDFVECDPAIFDALLKYVPGFPSQYPNFADAIEVFLQRDAGYSSDWWDYSWYPFISADFTWTFWGPETLARSPYVDPQYLTRIFLLSFNAETPYKSFRARVALAMNPNCPTEILDFLYKNRNSVDWLLNDADEEGVLLNANGKYSINEELESISERRADAELTQSFRYPTDTNWSSGPGAEYMANLLGLEWEADDAQTCLLAALAKNPALTDEKYLELATIDHPLVRYLLNQNRSIPADLQKLLDEEKPTFTFQPYGSNPRYTDEITLGADDELLEDTWFDLR
jgi:hypothetical protein